MVISLLLTACGPPSWWIDPKTEKQESEDAMDQGERVDGERVVIDMPFDEGYRSLCTQGAGGVYSHGAFSTLHDIDLDTPNDTDDPVYAPASGIAYPQRDDPMDNFGIHLNIDLGDGTYILMGHLSEIFVEMGEEVTYGQIVGIEGTTGDSSGDHVHLGRHLGDAAADAIYGESIEELYITAREEEWFIEDEYETGEMVCGLSDGYRYTSLLRTPRWHPNGTLVKTPTDARTYLIERGSVRHLVNEEVFLSYGYSFDEVAVISEEELSGYEAGDDISSTVTVQAVYHDGIVWVLFEDAAGGRMRRPLRDDGWREVLQTWGIFAESYDDLMTSDEFGGGIEDYRALRHALPFRDGSFVKEASAPDIYAIADGTAMPIQTWDAYLLLGGLGRTLVATSDGAVRAVMPRVGSCEMMRGCITRDHVLTRGGGDVFGPPPVARQSKSLAEGDLTIHWSAPIPSIDHVSLGGEFTGVVGGWPEGWKDNLVEAWNTPDLTYRLEGLERGDKFRFDVKYEEGGLTYTACEGSLSDPDLSGTLEVFTAEGRVTTTLEDVPESAACGFLAVMP